MSADIRNTSSSAYIAQHALDDVKVRFATGIALLVLIVPLMLVVFRIAVGEGQSLDFPTLLSTGLEIMAGIIALVLVRSGNFIPAGVILSASVLLDYWISPEFEIRTLLGLIGITTAAVLTGTRYYLGALGVVIVGQTLSIVSQIQANNHVITESVLNTIISTVLIILTSVFFRYFNNLAQSTAGRASVANQRLDAVSTIGRQTARLLNYEELIASAVNLMKTQFGFYHVQIFLVDDRREYASLVASTGEAGRRLMERHHRLAVGSDSVIGRVTLSNEAILVNDTENDPGHAFNPLLPETRAELALPMQVLIDNQTRVIGALDVQSTEPLAFTPSDVQALQALANQMAVSIRNARLFEAQAISLSENERLFAESQKNLTEIQRLNSQLTHKAWEGFLKANPNLNGVTATPLGVEENHGWTPQMIEASGNKAPVVTTTENGQSLITVPILLRGEVLGAIELEGGDSRHLDVLPTLVSMSDRMASALENMRLVEEAQAASVQEQRISAMVTRFQEAETIDELLQITLAELSETLDAEGGSIRVGLTQNAQTAR